MKNIFATLWNAVALAAVVFAGWSGYQTWQNIQYPPSADHVDIGPVIIEQIKHVNKQVFIEHYDSIEVHNFDAPEGWLGLLKNIGVHQEFVMLIRGRVPAGIDITKMTPNDIWVSDDGTRAQITLPPPQIFAENVALDMENSSILQSTDYCPGFICPDDRLTNFQRQVEPEAKKRLIAAAEEKGILTQAATDAQAYYEQLLNALGIAEVRVIVRGYSS
jgi:hypothetical protein